MEAFRTPDERFERLPDFDYEPRYREVGGLRLAHVDTGDGPPVVMVHGEPTWSFVWRHVIPPIRDVGYRCIAPDHAGFGRSDKPLDPSWQSLEQHVELTETLLEDLDLRDVTLVVHDWGGPIGMNIAASHPDRVCRVVVLDTVIDAREVWISESWVRFREFVESGEEFPVGELMNGTCYFGLPAEVVAAYEAPFPSPESKAALTGVPLSVPRADDEEGLAPGDRLIETLRGDPRPMLFVWGRDDAILTLASGQRLASSIGREIDHVIPEAGHGLPEDQGPLVGDLIADWLRDVG